MKEWKCLNCEKEMEYDNHHYLCLHCWCEASNMSCQCNKCITAKIDQEEEYNDEKHDIEMEREAEFDRIQRSIETDSGNTT